MENNILQLNDVCSFNKTNEQFGGFSNMCGGFPIIINGVRIPTSESLYQSCRFPDHPKFQKEIIGHNSPMSSKMCSKKHKKHTREDWDEVRVDIMRWCIQVKTCFHYIKTKKLMEETGDKSIVEISHKDRFWGMVKQKGNKEVVEGTNTLGELLMEERIRINTVELEDIFYIEPLDIENFRFMGELVLPVDQKFKIKINK